MRHHFIGLTDEMPFGKYEGRSPAEIMDLEGGVSYLKWAIDEMGNITFDDEIIDMVNASS